MKQGNNNKKNHNVTYSCDRMTKKNYRYDTIFFRLNLHQGGILRFGVYQDVCFFISTYEHETSTVEIDSMAVVQNFKETLID